MGVQHLKDTLKEGSRFYQSLVEAEKWTHAYKTYRYAFITANSADSSGTSLPEAEYLKLVAFVKRTLAESESGDCRIVPRVYGRARNMTWYRPGYVRPEALLDTRGG